MNVYLDIDGVLLANEENLAIGAAEFIKYAVEHFDVYWLTTHCMNSNPTHAIEYLNRASPALPNATQLIKSAVCPSFPSRLPLRSTASEYLAIAIWLSPLE
jgi:hypothetical protein